MLTGMTWPSSTQESSLGLDQLTKDFATLGQEKLFKVWIFGKKIQGRNMPLRTARICY